MTAVCTGGGTSSARPGFAPFVYVAPSTLGALLNNVPTLFAIPFAAAIGVMTFNLSTYCTTDAPTQPTLAAQDFIDLINFITHPVEAAAAQAKLQQWVGNILWPTFCMCDSGATPGPSVPSAPSGLPSLSPSGGPKPLPGAPCYQYNSPTFQMVAVFGQGNKPTTLGDPHTQAGAAPWPTGVDYIELVVTRTANGAVHDSIDITFRVTDDPAFTAGTSTKLFDTIPNGTTTFNVLGGPTSIGPRWGWFIDTFGDHTAATVSTDFFQYTVNAYCNGQNPRAGQSACCPPDPTLQLQLDQILALVTLIQRQAVPFGYVPGATHTGLSGAGVLSIQGLIGAKVDVTTMPTQIGRVGTSPQEFFDVGYITWGTADGYPQSVRIDHDQLLSLPARASAFTDLAYDLHAGVVVTITELVREP